MDLPLYPNLATVDNYSNRVNRNKSALEFAMVQQTIVVDSWFINLSKPIAKLEGFMRMEFIHLKCCLRSFLTFKMADKKFSVVTTKWKYSNRYALIGQQY